MIDTHPAQLLKSLVRIPSLSGNEAEAAKFVFDWARGRGLAAEFAGRNVLIRIGQGSGRRLLLNSHLDTVPASSGWAGDPFLPRCENGKIIALGANDAKGSVAAMLSAAARLAGETLDGEALFALTVDEETGSGGSGGLEWLVGGLGKIDAAVIGEPTSLEICVAQKGLLILEAETKGEACHAAHAEGLKKKNAVVEAAHAIVNLSRWKPGPEHELLGSTTVNVTVITGGTAHNVIPDKCRFCIDIRTVPGMTAGGIAREIEAMTGASVRIKSERMMPFSTDPGEKIVKDAMRASPKSKLVGSATMSDAVWVRHVPVIKIGPGSSLRSHTPEEYITEDELAEGTAFYESLVRKYLS